MKWIKKGLIYGPDGRSLWAKHSALQPTPYLLSENIIRVFLDFRDENGISRVGFVDLNSNNPSQVVSVTNMPALDIGIPGTFDENGVVPCAIVKREGKLFLYYAGYQLGQKIRFCAYSGLAISEDNGSTFQRFSQVPIMDRSDNELYFRVVHSILFEDGVWKAWYGGGSEFRRGKNKSLPIYDIRYIESRDGINFGNDGKVVITRNEDEYRIGRPYVIKDMNIYRMFFGGGTESSIYRLAYAESFDGINWKRKDDALGIDVSEGGWDSQMMAYPSVIQCKEKRYMFYNGNEYGRAGFGYAELLEW